MSTRRPFNQITSVNSFLALPYSSKSRKLLDACGNDQRKLFSDEEVCRKCTTPWSDTNYSIVINPIQMTKRRAAKVKRTVENKQQKGLTKRVSKASNNIIVSNRKFTNRESGLDLIHLTSRPSNVIYAKIVKELFCGKNPRIHVMAANGKWNQ